MKTKRIGTILNIIGMSVSLMVFLVLFAQVWYDYSFNRNIADYRNIYRLEQPEKSDANDYRYDYIVRTKAEIERFRSSSPYIVAACDYAELDMTVDFKMCFNDNGEIKKFDMPWTFTDTAFPTVFELDIVAGSTDAYNKENAALISEGYARTIFGDRDPVGEILTLEMFQYEYQIVGVYKDMPENCTVINGLLVNDGGNEETFLAVHTGFFRLMDGADPEEVVKSFPDCPQGTRLTPIAATHFLDDTRESIKPYANRTQLLILLSISLLFLIISIFNYINFSIASIPFNINEINIEKVYGASRGRLIFKQLKTNLIICLIASVLAVGLMEIVSKSQFASFSSCSLAVKDNITAILICLAVAITAAATGGLATALYSTSFAPGMVLKGEFTISGKGTSFRKVSMVLQFILSCVFLICGLMISRQTDYMVSQDNGFESENVLHMKTIFHDSWQDYFDELLKHPGIAEATCGESPIQEGTSSRNHMLSKDRIDEWYSIRFANDNYFEFFGFELIEGRFPDKGETGKGIINETFAKTYPDYQIGSKLDWPLESEIIGVVKDFNARPLMHKTEPMLYIAGSDYNHGDLYFRLNAENQEETIQWLEETVGGLFSFNGDSLAWESSFLEDDIEHMYRKELGQAKLITSSSVLCLLIALIGVLGIVYFETQVMKKEIAIRKVNGATTWEIISRLLIKYMSISSIGFIIALPLSILIMKWWLAGFAFQAVMPIWMFLLAYLMIMVLTAAVVILRSISAARTNPAETLKKE